MDSGAQSDVIDAAVSITSGLSGFLSSSTSSRVTFHSRASFSDAQKHKTPDKHRENH